MMEVESLLPQRQQVEHQVSHIIVIQVVQPRQRQQMLQVQVERQKMLEHITLRQQ